MQHEKKSPQRQLGPPGDRIKKLAERSHSARVVLDELHILQIIDDHQAEWFESTSEAERRSICSRMRVQIARALGRVVGFEVGLHGVVAVFSDFAYGGSLLFIGAALVIWLSRKGGG